MCTNSNCVVSIECTPYTAYLLKWIATEDGKGKPVFARISNNGEKLFIDCELCCESSLPNSACPFLESSLFAVSSLRKTDNTGPTKSTVRISIN
jgi:hypothetical protein